jgi:hypothetical protein
MKVGVESGKTTHTNHMRWADESANQDQIWYGLSKSFGPSVQYRYEPTKENHDDVATSTKRRLLTGGTDKRGKIRVAD